MSTGMMARWLLLGGMLVSMAASAVDTRQDVEIALSKPVIRGGIVFKHYCMLCHGERGDGNSVRAAKLYGNKVSLNIQPNSQVYYDKIIRKGGQAVGKSPSMPPWQDELSEEQLTDVVSYLSVIGTPERRGEVIFKTNCVLCHGVNGDGKGRASVLFDPPPANLTRSDKNDQYKEMIITLGGEAMGRSPVMPVWSEQLSKQEITDVVTYLRTILIKE